MCLASALKRLVQGYLDIHIEVRSAHSGKQAVADDAELPRAGAVGDRAMSARDHANGLVRIGELVDDAVRADAERAQSS